MVVHVVHIVHCTTLEVAIHIVTYYMALTEEIYNPYMAQFLW